MKRTLLAVIVGVQITWVLALAGYHGRAVREGTVIQVETRPVDPRDLLRGDFVRVGYEFSQLAGSDFEPPLDASTPLRRGDRVYVEMAPAPDTAFHRRVRVSREKLDVPEGHVLLRGTVEFPMQVHGSNLVRVSYGVERYFVAEGTGTPPADARMTAELSVASDGRAWLKQVYLNGRPYGEVMRE